MGTESVFRLRTLIDRGFKRYRCKSCGAYFWSLIPRDYCNDSPCVDYAFFNIKTYSGLTFKDVRDRFLYFFKRHGHEIIEPAPTVARWREDLYLTIASIVVFQPHVTSGLVPPPANPLVIAQPCIRLEDIDAIGYTFGRHLTNFIMGGHHAFNYPGKKVYWTEETVAYAKEFFVKEIGVPESELTFKESWWEGGGNAGPCFEVAVGGLEVATLVFMMYEVKDGNYVEIPLKIVDTGYGIERITWLVNKTPTAFHAIYGDLVSKYHKLLGIDEPMSEVLKVGSIYVGKVNVKDERSIEDHVSRIAKALDLPVKEVKEQLDGSIKVYTLLDHMKTALLLLSDGVVPSNSGEGYLVRLVLRRIFRLLKLLGKDSLEILNELAKLQINHFYQIYPQLLKRKDYVFEVLKNEYMKFSETLSRGSSIALKYIKRKRLDLNALIELYDSHGIPPEFVSEIASKYGLKIVVPRDFYSLVAKRHSRAPIKKVEAIKLPQEIIEWAKEFPETKRLFHKDPYIKVFSAKVLGVKGRYLILDQTAFYPEGGGQKCDTGIIKVGSTEVKVINVQSVNDVIVHELESEVTLSQGDVVTGVIDWDGRYAKMRHHTATHVILGATRRVLGDHVWQAGAEKTTEKGRLDITHYKLPTPEEIRKIEELANKVVNEGKQVNTYFLPRYEAEKKYGLTIYQGGVPLVPTLRIVEIPGWDAEACFGTHLRNTSELGGIKIINVEKIADGVVRLEYIAGTQLVNYLSNLENSLRNIARKLGGDVALIERRVDTFIEERKRLKDLISSYRALWTELMLSKVEREGIKVGDLTFFIFEDRIRDSEGVREFMIKVCRSEPRIVLVRVEYVGKTTLIEVALGKESTSVVDAVELIGKLRSTYGGKGGGKRDHAFLRVPKELSLDKLRSEIITYLKSKVGSD